MDREEQRRKSIARLAVETSKPEPAMPPSSEDEHYLRALQQVEERLKAEIAVRRSKSPVSPSTRPVAAAPTTHWLAHLATALTALGAAAAATVTLISALRKPPDAPTCVTPKEFQAELAKQHEVEQAQHDFEVELREKVMGVWELQGIKVVDPPGAPLRDPLELLPKPLVSTKRGSTKVPSAPLIQLRDPIPVPPPLP